MTQKAILQQLMPSLKSMVELPTLSMYLVSRQIVNIDQVKKLTVSETGNKCEIILKLVEILCQYNDCAQLLLSILEETDDKGDGTAATSELIAILKESIANPPSPLRGNPWDFPNGQGMQRRYNRRRRIGSRGTLSGYESSQSLESISEARGPDPHFERTQSDMEINHPQEFSPRMEGRRGRKLVISTPSIPPASYLAEQSQLVLNQASVCVLSTHANPIEEESVMLSKPIQCTGHSDGSPARGCEQCTKIASHTYALMDATDKITTDYAKFVLKTKQLVETRSSLKDVILFFLQKYSSNVPGGSLFPDITEIKQSATFHDLMDTLGRYMSWFEYGPLALLCQTFGGEDGDALVTEYETNLREYLKNCVHECPLISQDHPPDGYGKFSVKLAWNWDDTSYLRVRNFKRTLASILKSNPQSFFLREIERGCVLLTFLAPVEMCDHLERMAAEFPQALAVHDVMGVIVGERKTVIQQTILKFSWSSDCQAIHNDRSHASLTAMQPNAIAILDSVALKNLPHYFQGQEDTENSFMSQPEMSQVWEFNSNFLGSATSGSEFPTSGSEDYPQTSLSPEESQKSSSSYSTNKESQNEFDDGDTHLPMPRMKSLDTHPQGSAYLAPECKCGQVQTANSTVHSGAMHQSTRMLRELSNDQVTDNDTALLEATEALPFGKESILTNESHTSQLRSRAPPLPSMPNGSKEFTSELYPLPLIQCQQTHQRLPSGEHNNSHSHQEALLMTEQERKDQARSPVHSVPQQPPHPASYTSKANRLPQPENVEENPSADDRISSWCSACQAETTFSGVPSANCHGGLISQPSLRRLVLTQASSVDNLSFHPTKRDSMDSGYPCSGDSKRSSCVLSNCSTPESSSPRGSFSSHRQSPIHTVQPHSYLAQRDRTVSPLAQQEEIGSSTAGENPATSPFKPASVATKCVGTKVELICENLPAMSGVNIELHQSGQCKCVPHTKEHVCAQDEETIIATCNMCQNKCLSKRKREFRRKYGQRSVTAAEQVNVVISSPPANPDTTNLESETRDGPSTVNLLPAHQPLKGKADAVPFTTVGCSPSKVKLLCRPLQSRKKSCEATADDSLGSSSATTGHGSKNEDGNQGELSVNPTNLHSDTNKQEPHTEGELEHETTSPKRTGVSKVITKKSTSSRSYSTGTDTRTLATLGEDDIDGSYPDLARQYSADTTFFESNSTLCSSSLDHSRFSTLDQNDTRTGTGRAYKTVSLKSNASYKSTASGRSDLGYQTDQENQTPVTTPRLSTSSFPAGHVHIKSAERKQQMELDNIVEHSDLMTPTEPRKTMDNQFADGGYGTYKC